jgi:hypothetical protein
MNGDLVQPIIAAWDGLPTAIKAAAVAVVESVNL